MGFFGNVLAIGGTILGGLDVDEEGNAVWSESTLYRRRDDIEKIKNAWGGSEDDSDRYIEG